MAYPNIAETIDRLGRKGTDKITKLQGTITSVCHDLYGCVQVSLHTGLDKDDNIRDQHWYDIQRIEVDYNAPRVMTPPKFEETLSPGDYDSGPAAKPSPRAV